MWLQPRCARPHPPPSNHKDTMKTPLVVGYKGEIGSFILSCLLRTMPKALDILCVDINESREEVEARIHAATIIFLCVPMEETIPWLHKHRGVLGRTPIVEQCSMKAELHGTASLAALNLVGMHLLFRPSQTPDIADRRVGFLVGGTLSADLPTLEAIVRITQAQPVWYASPDAHDAEMAVQQALTHRTILVLDEMIKSCGGSTYICKKVSELATRIKAGDLELYSKIQSNVHLPDVMERFNDAMAEFKYKETHAI